MSEQYVRAINSSSHSHVFVINSAAKRTVQSVLCCTQLIAGKQRSVDPKKMKMFRQPTEYPQLHETVYA